MSLEPDDRAQQRRRDQDAADGRRRGRAGDDAVDLVQAVAQERRWRLPRAPPRTRGDRDEGRAEQSMPSVRIASAPRRPSMRRWGPAPQTGAATAEVGQTVARRAQASMAARPTPAKTSVATYGTSVAEPLQEAWHPGRSPPDPDEDIKPIAQRTDVHSRLNGIASAMTTMTAITACQRPAAPAEQLAFSERGAQQKIPEEREAPAPRSPRPRRRSRNRSGR